MPVVSEVHLGPYVLTGHATRSADGSPALYAEATYVVVALDGAALPSVVGLTRAPGSQEGRLRLGNFVGTLDLGGHHIEVHSRRMPTDVFEALLGDVADRLDVLPFAVSAPVSRAIDRDRIMGPDVLMHAFVIVRAAMNGNGPVDLPSAIETVVRRPHDRIVRDTRRVVALEDVDHVSADVLGSIVQHPERLATVLPGAPPPVAAFARRFEGLAPAQVGVARARHTFDTVENRFVVTVLHLVTDICGRMQRVAREANSPGLRACGQEARAYEASARRWLRHPVLHALRSLSAVPTQSTVLRGRGGYRQVSAFGRALMGRTRLASTATVATLLELRDAADLYEIWSYFQVVDALKEHLGAPPSINEFKITEVDARLPWGFRATWPDASLSATYNETFSRQPLGPLRHGTDSYALRMRPDIVIRTAGGSMHVLDAKLKITFTPDELDGESRGPAGDSTGAFRPEDVHKMHAYRDAIGARSAWALYPGTGLETSFTAPWSAVLGDGVEGVGAIPLQPGGTRTALDSVVGQILGDARLVSPEPPSAPISCVTS